MVRERRSQRGRPLPIAEKVLPFLMTRPADETQASDGGPETRSASDEEVLRQRRDAAETRVAEMWQRLQEAERRGGSVRELNDVETALLSEVAALRAAEQSLSCLVTR